MCEQCNDFVHLHVHSEFSLLDGLSRIPDLAGRAAELKQPALALTDHGTMYGTINFYRACKRAGVKPIIGLESYVAARRMTDMDPGYDRERFHVLYLAENQAGYLNLLRIATESQLHGYYYKPRIDHDLMAQTAEGLIVTTGCMAAEIPRAIGAGQTAKAEKLLGMYLDIYGRENMYVELQEHDIPELTQINRQLIEMAPRFGLQDRFLLTNDVHYTVAEEADPHEVLLCIQTGSTVAKPKLTFSNKEYYLKSAAEMSRLFNTYPHDVVRNGIHNSLLIAERCDVDLEPKGYHLPIFEVPHGHDAKSYLRHLCEEGLAWRYGADRAADDDALRRRLDHELNVIHRMGFDTYFLIVWDLCEFARRSERWWDQYGASWYPGQSYDQWRRSDIWWNVRGSGAGSVVAYALGITGIDPLANALIFERFLNPDRVSMPDFDLDYPDDRRHEMVEYAMRRYGADKVAQIITFGTMKARAAVRDVGRAMDMSLERVDEIARMIPAIPGKKVRIGDLFDADHEFHSPDFVKLYESDAAARGLIDTAQQLEGVSRHASSHAAGVIIGDKPLVEYVPLNRPTSGDAGLGGIDRVTQWDMDICESMGLLKVDFLGLSTLTILRTAVQLIEERHGVRYEMDTIPYDVGHVGPDPSKTPEAAFAMLSRGEVAGVFQVEGAGMRRLMIEMKPSRFDHIIAAIALYRPGPMQNIPEYIKRMHALLYDGRDIIAYHTPELEPILHDTYGIIVYQEQIIRMATELAGYQPGEADMLRRAVSKKKEKEMAKHAEKFTRGAIDNGIDPDAVHAIWEDIKTFARYGFNKAHAADYAVITCQTAFLKAHYPVEYLTALLSVEREKTEKVTRYLAEARRMGIEVQPPDINAARVRFTIEGGGARPLIRFGFGAIKNAGESALRVILDERDANGPFADVEDLCERVDLRRVGSRALESLVKVGVFDGWATRPQMLDAVKRMVAYSGKRHDEKNSGQMSLLGMLGDAVPSTRPQLILPAARVERHDLRQLLDWEKELIGVYLSEHPLEHRLRDLQERITADSTTLEATPTGKPITLAGMIASIRPYKTRKGDPMAFGVLEDLHGRVDLVFFPRTWAEVQDEAQEDQICLITGKVNRREEEISVIVDNVITTFERALAADGSADAAFTVRMDQWQMAEAGPEAVAANSPASSDPPAANVADDAPPAAWEMDDWDDAAPAGATTPAARPAAPPTTATARPANGHAGTNGRGAPASGADAFEASGAFVPPEPEFDDFWPEDARPAAAGRPQRVVTVEIRQDAPWQETCRRSVHLARRYDGRDQLRLRLLGARYAIDLPPGTTDFCDELAAELEQLPGVARVFAA